MNNKFVLFHPDACNTDNNESISITQHKVQILE